MTPFDFDFSFYVLNTFTFIIFAADNTEK